MIFHSFSLQHAQDIKEKRQLHSKSDAAELLLNGCGSILSVRLVVAKKCASCSYSDFILYLRRPRKYIARVSFFRTYCILEKKTLLVVTLSPMYFHTRAKNNKRRSILPGETVPFAEKESPRFTTPVLSVSQPAMQREAIIEMFMNPGEKR